MSKLTAAKRKALPASKFAGPDRSFPVDTKKRAVAAKGRATQAVDSGRMTPSTAKKIDAKANKKLDTHGVSKADMKGHEHLMGSKHFSGKAPAQPEAEESPSQSKDGLSKAAVQKSKTMIGASGV